jgi:hypothetical protein
MTTLDFIKEKYGSAEAYFESLIANKETRKNQLLNTFKPAEYRAEALMSLGKAEESDLEPEQEAMYYVALAQVFATLELVETLRLRD